MPEKKFKSKLRDKLGNAAKKSEAGGRTLGYKPLEGKHTSLSIPEGQRKSYFDQIKGKVVSASKKLAQGTLRSKLKDTATDVHKGLTDIRHPAQLIPAFEKGKTLGGIISALTKK
jgi:hypothetical protein